MSTSRSPFVKSAATLCLIFESIKHGIKNMSCTYIRYMALFPPNDLGHNANLIWKNYNPCRMSSCCQFRSPWISRTDRKCCSQADNREFSQVENSLIPWTLWNETGRQSPELVPYPYCFKVLTRQISHHVQKKAILSWKRCNTKVVS